MRDFRCDVKNAEDAVDFVRGLIRFYLELPFPVRHTGEGRYPAAEISIISWIPAFAGMTVFIPSVNS
jgi:hypothetical protein